MTEIEAEQSLRSVFADTLESIRSAQAEFTASPSLQEYGVVTYVGPGVARVRGLPNVQSEELVR